MDLRWCVPTIDVEAKIEGEQLGVGIFGFADESDESGDSELKGWIEGLTDCLESLIE